MCPPYRIAPRQVRPRLPPRHAIGLRSPSESETVELRILRECATHFKKTDSTLGLAVLNAICQRDARELPTDARAPTQPASAAIEWFYNEP